MKCNRKIVSVYLGTKIITKKLLQFIKINNLLMVKIKQFFYEKTT